MSNSLTIKEFWAKSVSSSAEGITLVKEYLLSLPELPKEVVLVSAGEVKPLIDTEVFAFYEWLKPQVTLSFVSAACVSIHAAILDFYHSESTERLIVSLELDKHLQQGCLNSLGIGNDEDQDGLDVVAGVGCCLLSRSYQLGDINVDYCEIVSQPLGVSGIHSVISHLSSSLTQLPNNVKPVSFDICSDWGKNLWKGLSARLSTAEFEREWLASAEQDEQHFLTLKPLHELSMYREQLHDAPLFLITLGGGGRVGLLQVSCQPLKLPKIEAVSSTACCLESDVAAFRDAAAYRSRCQNTYYKAVKQTLKYPHHQYRGKANAYFRWKL